MRLTNNTILITGGGSGIGRALAEYFHAKGNKVIIAGRCEDVLRQVSEANSGMEYAVLDIADAGSVASFAAAMGKKYPGLNVAIHNAGMMKPETIGDADVDTAEAIITTNLLGQIRLNSALLPLLKSQPDGAIMTVSSGLAFLPRADFPTYCASKAAIHSYTQSLRTQLHGSGLQVIELIPPYVQTELTGPDQATDDRALPLADFIAEVTAMLEHSPEATEIAVERVQFQRTAEQSGEYAKRYQEFQARFGLDA